MLLVLHFCSFALCILLYIPIRGDVIGTTERIR